MTGVSSLTFIEAEKYAARFDDWNLRENIVYKILFTKYYLLRQINALLQRKLSMNSISIIKVVIRFADVL